MPSSAEKSTPIARFGGLCELTLESPDHQALARFYRDAVGLPVLAEEADRVWLACGPCSRLGLWSVGEKEFGDRGGRHVHFAFSVDRGGLADLACRLAAASVACRGPVEHAGGDRSLYFEDPEGNVVEAWDFFTEGAGARDGVAALT
jgi:catechol-2,3-dioxygenase